MGGPENGPPSPPRSAARRKPGRYATAVGPEKASQALCECGGRYNELAMPAKNADLHGNAPDKAPAVLLLIDVINDMEYEGGDHTMVAAEVLSLHADITTEALLYYRGGYHLPVPHPNHISTS